jgi:hypothetical protein
MIDGFCLKLNILVLPQFGWRRGFPAQFDGIFDKGSRIQVKKTWADSMYISQNSEKSDDINELAHLGSGVMALITALDV